MDSLTYVAWGLNKYILPGVWGTEYYFSFLKAYVVLLQGLDDVEE